MNAYLIAAKANAWEVNQHVGRAIEADRYEREADASGCGAGAVGGEGAQRRPHLLKGLFSAA